MISLIVWNKIWFLDRKILWGILICEITENFGFIGRVIGYFFVDNFMGTFILCDYGEF